MFPDNLAFQGEVVKVRIKLSETGLKHSKRSTPLVKRFD